jgi:F0F1-type ATP synthase assembly protein I
MAKPWVEIGRYGSVGLELVLSIFLVAAFGHWLDTRYWGARGWGTDGGFLLGVVVGFLNLWRTTQKMQKDIERAEAADPAASRWTVDEKWVHKEKDDEPKG